MGVKAGGADRGRVGGWECMRHGVEVTDMDGKGMSNLVCGGERSSAAP